MLREKKRREQAEIKKSDETVNILEIGVPPEIGNVMALFEDKK